jgi:hypothetical protein
MNRQTEALRQQALVQRLMTPGDTSSPAGLRAHRLARGLAAYDTNAAGSAERALAGTFPTLLAMLGAEPFACLAQALWRAHPPSKGDLATWGDELPAFLAADVSLAEWPYLADCARLDAAAARCASAPDTAPDAGTWARLGDTEAHRLFLDLLPGVGLVESDFPVITLWRAHRADDTADRLAVARAALAEGRGECALVWRAGWRPEVSPLDAPAARFTASVMGGASLAEALRRAGEAFVFEPWLVAALRDGWLWRVRAGA